MALKRPYLLVLNAQRGRLRFKIFHHESLGLAISGTVSHIGADGSSIEVIEHDPKRMIMKNFPGGLLTHADALAAVQSYLKHWLDRVKTICHFVAYGGLEFDRPVTVSRPVLEQLDRLYAQAPHHHPASLRCIEYCLEKLPMIRNVAVFGTALSNTIPPHACRYPLPDPYRQPEIRKFSFDAAIHLDAARQAAERLGKPLKRLKLITCRLDDQSSVGAVAFGQLIDASIGFSPADTMIGLTTSGPVDHSLLISLMRRFNLTLGGIQELLNDQSGLRTMSGMNANLSEILTAAGHPLKPYRPSRTLSRSERTGAQRATATLLHQILSRIGSAALHAGGADYLVFCGEAAATHPTLCSLITRQVRKTFKTIKPFVVPVDPELLVARQATARPRHD